MPLFDLFPKEDRRAIYGRDAELATLVRLINERRWTVILGPRMVGKTSLAKAASHQSRRPTVYVNLWGARGTGGLLNALVAGLSANKPLLRRLRSALRRVTGVTVMGSGLTLHPSPRPLSTTEEVVRVVGEEARASVIILDEVQELGPAAPAFLKLLGRIFNSQLEVTFLFTGSYFGILRTLLEPAADSPLFGRSPARLELSPFDRTTSIGFLERGFREYRIGADRDELGSVVERSLDGMPGWLTLFGNNVAVGRMSIEEAERATLREGQRVARSELIHFLEPRDTETYWPALRLLTSAATWTEVREAIGSRDGSPANDNTVRNVLRALRDANLVSETDHQYQIRDPMVRSLIRSSPRPPG